MKNYLALSLLLLLPLCGCIPDHWPDKWVKMSQDSPPNPEPPMPQWCYKTLGQIDCYDAPRNDKGVLVTEPPPRILNQPEAQETVEPPPAPPPVPLHGN